MLWHQIPDMFVITKILQYVKDIVIIKFNIFVMTYFYCQFPDIFVITKNMACHEILHVYMFCLHQHYGIFTYIYPKNSPNVGKYQPILLHVWNIYLHLLPFGLYTWYDYPIYLEHLAVLSTSFSRQALSGESSSLEIDGDGRWMSESRPMINVGASD